MQQMIERPEVDGKSDDALVLMYPDNQLKDQVRGYEDTFSVFTVLQETFFPEK